jgi:hypothetical protein
MLNDDSPAELDDLKTQTLWLRLGTPGGYRRPRTLFIFSLGSGRLSDRASNQSQLRVGDLDGSKNGPPVMNVGVTRFSQEFFLALPPKKETPWITASSFCFAVSEAVEYGDRLSFGHHVLLRYLRERAD